MPAAYAHHIFGEACLQHMPEKLKKVCTHYRELYDFGVHGPDLLFYYEPLHSNEINRYGSQLHTLSGREFFSICAEAMKRQAEEASQKDRLALLAYVLGYLAHFTLDSHCHGYINRMADETDLSHNRIESQYEAYLMQSDGKKALKVDRSRTLHPSAENASVAACLYPYDAKQILKAMHGQKRTLHLFYSPMQAKKRVIRKLIGMLRMKGDFGDLFLDREILPQCSAMNRQIYKLQQQALTDYPDMLYSLMRYLRGKEALDEHFAYDFEGEEHTHV